MATASMAASIDQDLTPPGGGLLGRFENVRTKSSCKRIVPCNAATPEYQRVDYLKPSHLPLDIVDEAANYAPTCNINETKFHKGFARRNRADIQSDAARLEKEIHQQIRREDRAYEVVENAKYYKEQVTFNILTGEGVGRECEFRSIGKKIVNPYGSMDAVYSEHSKDAQNRIRNSGHRYFEHPAPQPTAERQFNIFNDGLFQTKRESAVIGYGNGGNSRTRGLSCGVADNYQHLKAVPPEPIYETPHYGNKSQIILG